MKHVGDMSFNMHIIYVFGLYNKLSTLFKVS